MSPLSGVPSPELLARLRALVAREQALEADLVLHLGEVDARRLYLPAGCASMFRYCVEVLHLAEGVAYKRIAVARAARKHPALVAALRAGEIHLTAASLLAPHLQGPNVDRLLARARHRSVEEVRCMVADLRPRADLNAGVRRVVPAGASKPVKPSATAPTAQPAHSHASPAPEAPTPTGSATSGREQPGEAAPRPEPLGNSRYAVRFMADETCHRELLELRALLRHQIPDGDLAKVLARAIAELLAKVRKQKFAAVAQPRGPKTGDQPQPGRPGSRHIPAAVRREVVERDEGRCAFVADDGRRCTETGFVEFHHTKPWARNRRHDPHEISLRCRAHNTHHAFQDFGERHMRTFARSGPAHDSLGAAELDPNPVRELDPNPVEAG